MSEHLKLGELITTEQQRDCVHIAVCPVVARDELRAGTNVSLDESGRAIDSAVNAIGVVDPFLKAIVQPGQRFWLFLYPGSITSLRHLWSHPALPLDESQEARTLAQDKARAWLTKLAEDHDTDLDTLLKACNAMDGDYMLDETSAQELSRATDGEAAGELFWSHVETLLGKQVPYQKRNQYFNCRC